MTTQNSPPVKRPEEPDLQPPDAGEDIPRKGNLLFVLMVAFTLFLILDIAIIAYFFLVHKREKVRAPVQQERHFVEETNPSGIEIADEGQSSAGLETLRAVEQKRNSWLKRQAMAEADDIRTWGGSDFTALLGQVTAAERSLADKQYALAESLYQQAMDGLQILLAKKPAMLAESIDAGNAALEAGDSAGAVKAFTRALVLSPTDQQAMHGLARARTLDQVLALYQKGLDAEEQADLKDAQALLFEAKNLDPEFLPAAQALHRVQSRQAEADFERAMGGFLQALHDGRAIEAKKKLTLAAGLRPQSPAVLEGKKQLQQLTLQQTLARIQTEYVRFVHAEQWRQAQERCKQALKIDPQASFALVGLREAGRRLDLDIALQAILDQPQRLQEQDVQQGARQTLAFAESVVKPGPRLQAQLTAVKRQLQAASLQVPVILRSDNETEVVIYRIGRQGKFNRRELRLRPGRYTVVGSRPGYRDVRKVLEVRAEDEQVNLDIDCREVI